MTPYYSDDFATIYHGDCRGITEWLAADVLVTDPPYGIGWTTHGISRTSNANKRAKNYDGAERPTEQIANDESTKTRDAALRMWGDRPALVFGSLLVAPPTGARHVAVYVKPSDAGALTGVAKLRRDVEAIYLLGQSGEWARDVAEVPRSDIPSGRRPPTSWRSSVFATKVRRSGSAQGLAATSGHPHAKPCDVLGELIGLHPGIVADPFMGSGSTLRAAKDLGRKCIGVEIDERYCEIAAKRLAQEVLDFGGAA